MATFPVTPLRNLPFASNLSAGSLDLVGVDGSTARAVRIHFADLTTNYVIKAGDEPDTPGSTETGDLYVTSSGLLSNVPEEGWGKSPRYTTHWSDLTPGVRFLLVNKVMEDITDVERNNARATLDISIAGEDHLGLIKAAETQWVDAKDAAHLRLLRIDETSEEYDEYSALNGRAVIPYATPTEAGAVYIGFRPDMDPEDYSAGEDPVDHHAAVTRDYLDFRFEGLRRQQTFPVASYSSMGGVIPYSGQFRLSTGYDHDTGAWNEKEGEYLILREATYPDERFSDPSQYSAVPPMGVKLAYSSAYLSDDGNETLSDVDIDKVTTVERVRSEVDYQVREVKKLRADYQGTTENSGFGMVAMAPDGALVASYTGSGILDVRPATGYDYGAVLIADSIGRDTYSGQDYSSIGGRVYSTAVTPGAVKTYVDETVAATFSSSVLSQWAMRTFPSPTDTHRGIAGIDGDTIRTYSAIDEDGYPMDCLYVPDAGPDDKGVVYLYTSTISGVASTEYAVSAAAMVDYVNAATSNITWNGGEVFGSAKFYSGVYDEKVYSPGYEYANTQLVTYSKVSDMISEGTELYGGTMYSDLVFSGGGDIILNENSWVLANEGARMSYVSYTSDYDDYSDGDVLPKAMVVAAIESLQPPTSAFSGYLYGTRFYSTGTTRGVIEYPSAVNIPFDFYLDNTLVPKIAIEGKLTTMYSELRDGGLRKSGDTMAGNGAVLSYAFDSASDFASYSDNNLVPKKAITQRLDGILDGKLSKTGDTLTSGRLSYDASSPSTWASGYSDNNLVPKKAVANALAGYFPRTGGAITGKITYPASLSGYNGDNDLVPRKEVVAIAQMYSGGGGESLWVYSSDSTVVPKPQAGSSEPPVVASEGGMAVYNYSSSGGGSLSGPHRVKAGACATISYDNTDPYSTSTSPVAISYSEYSNAAVVHVSCAYTDYHLHVQSAFSYMGYGEHIRAYITGCKGVTVKSRSVGPYPEPSEGSYEAYNFARLLAATPTSDDISSHAYSFYYTDTVSFSYDLNTLELDVYRNVVDGSFECKAIIPVKTSWYR